MGVSHFPLGWIALLAGPKPGTEPTERATKAGNSLSLQNGSEVMLVNQLREEEVQGLLDSQLCCSQIHESFPLGVVDSQQAGHISGSLIHSF